MEDRDAGRVCRRGWLLLGLLLRWGRGRLGRGEGTRRIGGGVVRGWWLLLLCGWERRREGRCIGRILVRRMLVRFWVSGWMDCVKRWDREVTDEVE